MAEAGVGVAVIPEAAARRYRRSMQIKLVRMADAWASRRLAICMRSKPSLPKPVRQLADHLKLFAKPRGRVIARSAATKQSILLLASAALDCFASLAMTKMSIRLRVFAEG